MKTLLLLTALVGAEPDTMIVEVRLSGVGAEWVLAQGTLPDSLHFEAAPIFKLAGLGSPPSAWMGREELSEALGVGLRWDPVRLVLTIDDLQYLLPATRRERDRTLVTAHTETYSTQRRSGMFGAVTANDEGDHTVDLGYSLVWIAGWATHSSVSGVSWSASLSPLRGVWLSYRDGEQLDPSVNARANFGWGFVGADYSREEVHAQGALVLGPVTAYATTREQFVVTWRGPVVATVGHSGQQDISSVRVSWGAVYPSPFTVPGIR